MTAAAALNDEYKAKLHKDDLQFLKWGAELSHWERKCESQAKEITKLTDYLRAAKALCQQQEEQLAAAAPVVGTTAGAPHTNIIQVRIVKLT